MTFNECLENGYIFKVYPHSIRFEKEEKTCGIFNITRGEQMTCRQKFDMVMELKKKDKKLADQGASILKKIFSYKNNYYVFTKDSIRKL